MMKRRGPTLSSISETEGTCDFLPGASPATACTATSSSSSSSPASSRAEWDDPLFQDEANAYSYYSPPPLLFGRSRDDAPSIKYRSLLLRKRLLVILCCLSVTTWTLCSQRLWAVQDGRVTYWNNNHMNHSGNYDRSLPRQLFQDLPTVRHGFRYTTSALRTIREERPADHPWVKTSSSMVLNPDLNILEHAGYTAKPIMMGMLWPESSTKKPTTEVDIASLLVVSINPHTFQVTPAKSSTTQSSTATKSSATTRRSILPPNFNKLFPAFITGGNPRNVTFDINYTMTYDPRLEEVDEGFPWPIPDGCEMQYDWQSESHPTCNTLHEQDVPTELTTTFASSSSPSIINKNNNNNKHDSMRAQLLAAGGYRNVWMIHNGTQVAASTTTQLTTDDNVITRDPPIALKTLLYERDWYQMQYKRHNLDALVASRLQSSPYILNIHGYCGTSGLYEFARGGNLQSVTEKYFNTFTPRIKVELSYNVAHAIADLHNMAKEGVPVVSHTDIFPNQFVRLEESDPYFLLNDFNRARWVNLPVVNNDTSSSNNMTKQSCGFTFPRNRGKFRSPEEYRYQLETEAVDVYSAGNIFYYLLVGEFPFASRSRDTVKRSLKAGKRQRIPEEYATSEDPLIQALVKAIRMCWIQIPADRATARQVQNHLGRAMKAPKKEQ